MCASIQIALRRTLVVVAFWALLTAMTIVGFSPSQKVHAQSAATAEPAPPTGQTYIGAKDCASCHFKQFMSWKKTKHSKTFDLLTAKYETDVTCLKCHTTGYGEATGFKDKVTTASLAGTTCESCHGPGSKHAEVCKAFGKEKLNAEQEKQARDSIWSMLPTNVCVQCHKVQGHGESTTPADMKAG